MKFDPHTSHRIERLGAALGEAEGAIILLHGRGGSSGDILGLGEAFAPEGWALLAPQADAHSWYPYSFLAPRAQNEPYLSAALARVQATLTLAREVGLTPERIAISGFSQGACLATEFTGRNPQRFAALLAFTGGLIGPLNEPITLAGDLVGTPVLLSSGDPDPHVPWERVQQSAELLADIGGQVTLRRFPGRQHAISPQEIDEARAMLALAKKGLGSSQTSGR